jgi:transposase
MGNQARVFSPEFKLAAVQRLVAGEKVKALAEELGVSRQLLYKWWNHYERGGPAALRLPGRPAPAGGGAGDRGREPAEDHAGPAPAGPAESRRRSEQTHRRAGAQGRRPGARDRFFQKSLAAREGTTPGERRTWRRSVFQLQIENVGSKGSSLLLIACTTELAT